MCVLRPASKGATSQRPRSLLSSLHNGCNHSRPELRQGARRDFPHDQIVNTIIAMAQQVADGRDFGPRLLGELVFQFVWNASARLPYDLNTALDRAAQLVVAPVARKIDTHHHFSNRVDGFENVAQANKIA